MSLGISTMIPQKDMTPQDIIKFADKALYEAKDKGRNCYVIKDNK